jgi:hypothetical protein
MHLPHHVLHPPHHVLLTLPHHVRMAAHLTAVGIGLTVVLLLFSLSAMRLVVRAATRQVHAICKSSHQSQLTFTELNMAQPCV